MLFSQSAIVSSDSLAVARIRRGGDLIDQIADCGCMPLGRTKHQGLLRLIDHAHELLNSKLLAFLDLNDLVELSFGVFPSFLYLSLLHIIVCGIDVLIDGGLNFFEAERTEKAIIDALFEGLLIDRISEILVSVTIDITLGCRGEAQLYCRREMIHDVSPRALIICSSTMALVNDDEIEKVFWVFSKIRRCIWPAHERLEDGEEDAAVFLYAPLLLYLRGTDAHQCIFFKCTESIEGLIGQHIPVGKE